MGRCAKQIVLDQILNGSEIAKESFTFVATTFAAKGFIREVMERRRTVLGLLSNKILPLSHKADTTLGGYVSPT